MRFVSLIINTVKYSRHLLADAILKFLKHFEAYMLPQHKDMNMILLESKIV